MAKYHGASFIIFAKRREERFILLTNNDELKTFYDKLIHPTNSFDQLVNYILPPEITKYTMITKHEIPNDNYYTGKPYYPCILYQVDYGLIAELKRYPNYVAVKLDNMFPYQYEPCPGAESYQLSKFYQELYVKKSSYQNIFNPLAKTLFHNYNRIMYVL